jgi:hypothetical protein
MIEKYNIIITHKAPHKHKYKHNYSLKRIKRQEAIENVVIAHPMFNVIDGRALYW